MAKHRRAQLKRRWLAILILGLVFLSLVGIPLHYANALGHSGHELRTMSAEQRASLTGRLVDPTGEPVEGSSLFKTDVRYVLEYQQGLKDEYDYAAGDRIQVRQKGYSFGRFNVFEPTAPPMEAGKTYLLFVKDNYLYSFETYPEVIDGAIYPLGESELFEEGTILEDLINIISN